jgi:signal peptidase II
MAKKLSFSVAIFAFLFLIDQYIKMFFVDGFGVDGECISLVLAYNKGVAFSMFAFLEDNLKFIQLGMIFAGVIYLLFNKDVFNNYYIPVSILFAGGISNIYDRFIHEGVVDYVYWHCGFDFAIFNLADVLIDIAVVWMIYISYKKDKEEKAKENLL